MQPIKYFVFWEASIFLAARLTVFLFCLVSVGCVNLANVKNEANEALESVVMTGYVSASNEWKGPVVVLACFKGQGKWQVAHFVRLEAPGEYELMVKQGTYFICAFLDRNNNFTYDRGEPAGQYGEPKMVAAKNGGVLVDLDFFIPEKETRIELPYGFKVSESSPWHYQSRKAGVQKKLDDDLFAEDRGGQGLWRPYKFYQEVGVNIYFLDKYDPKKIPILFIHGAGGTPKGWQFFVDNIDLNRFQPWFFYYPTGARLKSTSYLLFWKLFNLQLKYKFQHLYITAHSMGGLVARSFIVDYGDYFPSLELFVSLATPWGGDIMADYGVKQSPVVVPNWIDMQSQGKFIASLYRKKLPSNLRFYLFFGYSGTRNGFKTNNDGTINFNSLLDWRAQSEAEKCFGFNEDHASIALSKDVIRQYNAVINTHAKRLETTDRRPEGDLEIKFSYDFPSGRSLPWPILLLRSKERKQQETVFYLTTAANDKTLGPLPVGKYSACLIAMGARPKDNCIPLSIKPNQTTALNFTMVPDGIICGTVPTGSESQKKSDADNGSPKIADPKEHAVQSVTLIGPQTQRTLRPTKCENTYFKDYMIAGQDFFCNGYFNFFELPSGEYQLSINQQDIAPIVTKYHVLPGSFGSVKRLQGYWIDTRPSERFDSDAMSLASGPDIHNEKYQGFLQNNLYKFFLWVTETYENAF